MIKQKNAVTHVSQINTFVGVQKVFVEMIRIMIIHARRMEIETENKKNPKTIDISMKLDKRTFVLFEAI